LPNPAAWSEASLRDKSMTGAFKQR
jgi:hypothetical protein